MPPHYCFHILPHIFQQLMWSTQNKKTELLTQKNSLKRRFSEKGGPSDRIRTGGILLPNLSGTLFLLVYSGFQPFSICFIYSLALLSPLFPGVPEPSVVIYVVKNASRPVSGEGSPVPDGKRFAFLCGLHCNSEEGVMQVVSEQRAVQRLSRYRQRIASRLRSLKVKLAFPQ